MLRSESPKAEERKPRADEHALCLAMPSQTSSSSKSDKGGLGAADIARPLGMAGQGQLVGADLHGGVIHGPGLKRRPALCTLKREIMSS